MAELPSFARVIMAIRWLGCDDAATRVAMPAIAVQLGVFLCSLSCLLYACFARHCLCAWLSPFSLPGSGRRSYNGNTLALSSPMTCFQSLCAFRQQVCSFDLLLVLYFDKSLSGLA
jgi:hypothetical protein